MVVLPIDNPAKPSKIFVIELAPAILGYQSEVTQPAKGVLVYTVDASIEDLHSPLTIIPRKPAYPKTAHPKDDPFGPLRDAAYDVGQEMSKTVGGASLSVKVNQKIGDCYNVTINYSRH